MIVAALQEETKKLPRVILHTGVGKINAAASLTEAILKDKPDIVINYGTAGKSSDRVEVGKLYRVDQIIQRDMDASPLGFRKVSNTIWYEKNCANDEHKKSYCMCYWYSFWTGGDEGKHDVVDMEAYALAAVCVKHDIPFVCYKYISDDGDAAQWTENCERGVLSSNKGY